MLSGRYEIIELVGSGGMSEVYKAKCHVLNRYVAIKVLKPEFSSDVNFVTKFRIEAQSAAGLSHPNIVNVYDVGEDNDPQGIYTGPRQNRAYAGDRFCHTDSPGTSGSP